LRLRISSKGAAAQLPKNPYFTNYRYRGCE
jgi:hypothetical protein